jgi:hypothetical protein
MKNYISVYFVPVMPVKNNMRAAYVVGMTPSSPFENGLLTNLDSQPGRPRRLALRGSKVSHLTFTDHLCASSMMLRSPDTLDSGFLIHSCQGGLRAAVWRGGGTGKGGRASGPPYSMQISLGSPCGTCPVVTGCQKDGTVQAFVCTTHTPPLS